jgi:dipeptidyl aminopeptidase/acylaminoacyl peptidase
MKTWALSLAGLFLLLVLASLHFAAPAPAPQSPKLRAALEPQETNIFHGWHWLVFSPDSKILASGARTSHDKGPTVKLWNVAEATEIATLKVEGQKGTDGSACPAFSPDGKSLATGDGYGIYLWDAMGGKKTPATTLTDRPSSELLFSPDGKMLVSRPPDQGIDLWDLDKKELRLTREQTLRMVYRNLFYTPEGKLLAVGRSTEKPIPLYDVIEKKTIATLELSPGDGADCVAFSPDGKTLGGGAYFQDNICLWDVATGKTKLRLKLENHVCCSLAFNPKGTILAAGRRDKKDLRSPGISEGSIALYEVATGKELAILKGGKGAPTCLAFSPDGRTLASCTGYESTIRLWSIPEPIQPAKPEPAPEEKK